MCVQLAKHENNCLPNDYNDKNCNFPNIVNTAKTGPGSKFLDGVLILVKFPDISNMLGRQIYGPLRRPFKLYVV